MTKPIVTAQWLNNNLENAGLIILDASQKTNKAGLKVDFDAVQIKGARFFDLDNEFCEKDSEFPNTLPNPKHFETGCKKLGINKSSKIVIYDNLGIYSSPRAWWLFKIMGHKDVSVLDGGLPDWVKQGYATEKKEKREFESGDFEVRFQPEMVKDYNFMSSNLRAQKALVVDARPAGRFNGTAPEPREGLRSGHIPDSINIPFEMVLENGKYKSETELAELFKTIKTEERPLVFSCGSGITACVVLLATELVFEHDKAVYDGSWTEWATIRKTEN